MAAEKVTTSDMFPLELFSISVPGTPRKRDSPPVELEIIKDGATFFFYIYVFTRFLFFH